MITIEEVETFCKSIRVGLPDCNVELEDGEIRISMRETVDDEPTQKTFIEARGVIKAIRDKFGDAVKVGSEEIDEWIDVTVKLK